MAHFISCLLFPPLQPQEASGLAEAQASNDSHVLMRPEPITRFPALQDLQDLCGRLPDYPQVRIGDGILGLGRHQRSWL
jgi:hypothetical protein